MSLLKPASTLWLLAHEMRLSWRGRRRSKNSSARAVWVSLAIALTGLSVGGWFLAPVLNQVPTHAGASMALVLDGILLVLFTFMLSQTLSQAATVFFERGDLDLLLSSPIPPRRVLTVRCAGLAANAAVLYVLLISPLILPAVIQGRPQWLNVYPLLIGLSLLATALGLILAQVFFAVLGPRRTRTFAQVLSAVIGASIYLGSQAARFVGRDRTRQMAEWFQQLRASGAFAPDQPAAFPARALLGDLVPAVVLYGSALAIFLTVVAVLGGRFARNAAAAAGAGIVSGRKPRGPARGFRGGPFAAMLRKDLRLIRRDIALLSQVLLRVLYLLPMAFFAFRGANAFGYTQPLLAAGLVFITGQIAGSLAWIAASGEEGLELIACSPAPASTLRRAKLVSALIPTAWLVALPIAGLTFISPLVGATTAFCCAGAAVSAGLIAVWHEKPAKRSDFRRRRSGSLPVALAAFVVEICWAGAASIAAGPLWIAWAAFAPVCIAVIAVLALRKPDRTYAEVLQSI